MPALTPGFTLTAQLHDLIGTATTGARVKVTLCGFGLQDPAIPGTSVVATIEQTLIPSGTGTITQVFWGNDQITPAGTFYCVQVIDAKKNIVWARNFQFNGTGGNLADLIPFDPPPPTSGGSRVVEVRSLANQAVFDCFLGSTITTTFHIILTEHTTGSVVNVRPGTPYIFIIEQDSVGGWLFFWPDNAGAGIFPPNPTPGSSTQQSFVGIDNSRNVSGSIVAIAPGQYFG